MENIYKICTALFHFAKTKMRRESKPEGSKS